MTSNDVPICALLREAAHCLLRPMLQALALFCRPVDDSVRYSNSGLAKLFEGACPNYP